MWYSAWCHSDHFIYWSAKQKRQRETADHPLLSPLGLNVKEWQTHRDVSESSSRVKKKKLNGKVSKEASFFFYSSQANSVTYTLFTPLSLLTADTKSNGKVHTYIFVAGGDAGEIWDPHQVSSLALLTGEVLSLWPTPHPEGIHRLVWFRAAVQSVKWFKNSSL